VKTIRAEIDEFIDTLAKRDAKAHPGVPYQVLRNLITAQGEGCQCATYLNLKAKDEAARAREERAA